jgi:hypothetical protein
MQVFHDDLLELNGENNQPMRATPAAAADNV